METIEQFARILLAAESLGGPCLLTMSQIQKLNGARTRSLFAQQQASHPRLSSLAWCEGTDLASDEENEGILVSCTPEVQEPKR
jgi:hypothetical protein